MQEMQALKKTHVRMEDKKKRFIELLKESGCIASVACDRIGISYSTYRRWYNSDAEFAVQVDDCNDRRTDYVESKLMERINGGDITAIIFYLKTQGRSRGWTEKNLPKLQNKPVEAVGEKVSTSMQRRITGKKTYIVKLLKKEGKYTPELALQVKIVAQLLVRTEILAEQIFSDCHNPTNIELSREGNERESINPKEKLYLDLLEQSQKALKALGMNTDSRERKYDNDGFNEFMEQFQDKGD